MTDDQAFEDPRIQRTRRHVLTTVTTLLAEGIEPTFVAVAERANVSRQTLYKHWGTVENMVADTIVFTRPNWLKHYAGKSTQERAHMFLTQVARDTVDRMAAAITVQLSASSYNSEAASAYDKVAATVYEMFIEAVGPLSHDEFYEVVAPIALLKLAGSPVSEQLIESLSRRAPDFID